MGSLGHRRAVGIAGNAVYPNRLITGGWVVMFPPAALPYNESCEMWHAAVTGPGGYFLVYLDDALFGVGQNGQLNEYSPRGSAMYITRGQTVSMHWSIATGTAPVVYIYLREPEVGRL